VRCTPALSDEEAVETLTSFVDGGIGGRSTSSRSKA
jgi:hypothetical protein